MIHPRRVTLPAALAVVALVALSTSGCATFREVANLAQVDFRLQQLSQLRLAGVDLRNIDSVDDLTPVDIGRIAVAVSRNELPLDFVLDVSADNSGAGASRARLTQLDWTLLLEDRETVTGRIDREYVLEPGTVTTVPVPVSLDLVEFFEGSATDLAELVLSLADADGSPTRVALRALPTIETPFGSFRYPEPILIEGEIGGR